MKNILSDEDRKNLIVRINNLSENDKRLWGKMNVNQMVCHITDQLRMSMEEIKTKYMGSKLQETLLKRLVLIGMPIPKGKAETAMEIKQGEGGTPPTNLRNDIKTFIIQINKFDSNFKQTQITKHPTFGNMDKKEWARLAYVHINYHLKQFGR
jgi:hypothetical protein